MLEAVCILLNQKPDWETAKRVMSDVQFLQRLLHFDKDKIDPVGLEKVRTYTEEPHFQPSLVARVSVAAKSLCMWVRAIVTYSDVVKLVAPREERLHEAAQACDNAMRQLQLKKDKLNVIEEEMAALEFRLEQAQSERDQLVEEMSQTEARLGRATELTNRLTEEEARWSRQSADIETEMSRLVSTVFLASAYVAYCGPFTANFRASLCLGWRKLLKAANLPEPDDPFTLQKHISDHVTVLKWLKDGLPSDQVSIENAVIMDNADSCPLLIDPHGQATVWLRNSHSELDMRIAKGSVEAILPTLKHCLQQGLLFVLEGIGDTLEAVLEPLFLKQTFKDPSGRQLIKIAGQEYEYSEYFSLVVTTARSKPQFGADVFIRMNVINFSVTRKGLEEQLMSFAVRVEKPSLEAKRDQLVREIAEDKIDLLDVEDRIIRIMSTTDETLLDDEGLVTALVESKEAFAHLRENLRQNKITEHEIDEARDIFQEFAQR